MALAQLSGHILGFLSSELHSYIYFRQKLLHKETCMYAQPNQRIPCLHSSNFLICLQVPVLCSCSRPPLLIPPPTITLPSLTPLPHSPPSHSSPHFPSSSLTPSPSSVDAPQEKKEVSQKRVASTMSVAYCSFHSGMCITTLFI